jgi:multidrug efflux pump subunit AcrA (membrane-fusion protein)
MIIRAWDEFRDLAGNRHDVGVMSWDRSDIHRPPVQEGDELPPFRTLGGVSIGRGTGDGVWMGISAPTFGTIKRLLVADGEQVRPGQALMEFEERPPTTEEWAAEWERANRAEDRLRDRERLLDSPYRALATGIRRKLGRY